MGVYRLTVRYDGTPFSGWQIQDDEPTVQGEIENALATVLREPVRITGAGRTDAGVHALGQVANFHWDGEIDLGESLRSLNALTPPEIAVIDFEVAPPDFDARRSPSRKRYRYAILNSNYPDPFLNCFCWRIQMPLDWEAMEAAGRILIGEHDFAAFRAAGSEDRGTVRPLDSIEFGSGGFLAVGEQSENLHHIDFTAPGFLYKMVRNLVGTLVDVGLGKLTSEDVGKILESRDRTQASKTAPARGLCLIEVCYEDGS